MSFDLAVRFLIAWEEEYKIALHEETIHLMSGNPTNQALATNRVKFDFVMLKSDVQHDCCPMQIVKWGLRLAAKTA
jgi:hypothetical protein